MLRSATTKEAETVNRFGKLAPHFEPNVGQSDGEILFLSRGKNYTLFLAEDHATIRLHNGEAGYSDVKLKWEGAATKPEISAEGLLASYSNYFRGSDPSKWRTEVPHYRSVRYREIWPGIDLVFHGDNKDLEWDFVVLPGGDPDRIGFIVEGAGDLELNEAGELILDTQFGKTKLKKPLIYQDAPGQQSGERSIIDGQYELASSGRIGFHLGDYDTGRRLVIDPVISYSTYLGGNFDDYGHDIAVDANGYAVVTGSTISKYWSDSFPTTGGAFQTGSTGPGSHAFISKLSQDGSALVFSTFLGGGSEDYLRVALDSTGNIYVTGSTGSKDFPTTEGAYLERRKSIDTNTFVTKLLPSGSALEYSTYIGPAVPRDIAVDSEGNVYVAANTSDTDFPITANAFQPWLNGDMDAVVFKLDAAGAVLDYSTYLGGRTNDHALGITIDSAGYAYVAGNTNSDDFPTSPGSYQAVRLNNDKSYYYDAFLAKLSNTGSVLIYSTYLGGRNNDRITDLHVDSGGLVYVAGITESDNFPTTPGAYQTSKPSSAKDAFVSVLSGSGTGLQHSTFCWQVDSDNDTKMAVSALGEVYLSGGASLGLPSSPLAFQPFPINSTWGPYIAKLSSDLSAMEYSSPLGGGYREYLSDLQLDLSGNVYLVGYTKSTTFPTTNGAFQTSKVHDTYYDAFITKIEPSQTPCAYAVSPTNLDLDWREQNAEIEVTVNDGCVWRLTDYYGSYNWLTPDKIINVGPDTLTLSVNKNHSIYERSDSIIVAGQSVEIKQQGELCSHTLTPESRAFGTGGGISTVSVIAPHGCRWQANSNAAWLSILQGSTGNGDGIVQFSVDYNTGSPRSSSISIADQVFSVTQSGSGDQGIPPGPPDYISPENGDSNAAAVPVLQWQSVEGATSYSVYIGLEDVDFLKLAQADLTSTNYIVTGLSAGATYIWKVVAKNQWGDSAASSPIWSFSVTTSATSITPESKGFPLQGGTGLINVTANTGFPWIAWSNDDWITITSDPSGSGNGTVEYSVDAYGGSAAREGVLIVAGNTFTVTQMGPESFLITTYAGTGVSGYSGDGGLATMAKMGNSYSVAADPEGNIYIPDSNKYHVIRKVDATTGIISRVAGRVSIYGYSGDGGPAIEAKLYRPFGVTLDSTGNLFIADRGNHAIRKVDAVTGIITTLAGTGAHGYSGDGGQATAAQLNTPHSLAFDAADNLLIVDYDNHVVRRVDVITGIITTVVGTGSFGYSGDGGPSTAARLYWPDGLASDAVGNLFIADSANHVIRKVDASTSIISTIAGSGNSGYQGDGTLATTASLYSPKGIAIDGAGNLFIADKSNHVVRRVDAVTGIITTVVGTGVEGYAGDGGPASLARLRSPYGVALDEAGNLYISDSDSLVIRKVHGIGQNSSSSETTNNSGHHQRSQLSARHACS